MHPGRVLCFGHNGQTGLYLQTLCRKLGYEFLGLSRNCLSNAPNSYFIDNCDVSDPRQVAYTMLTVKPNIVINLAAKSSISHKYTREHYETIVLGNLNILEGALHLKQEKGIDVKVFVTGSGLQFKNEGKPISANDQFEARDSYSAARIAAAYQARYWRTLGIKVYIGYLFHHESMFRSMNCISQKILRAAQEKEKIDIGDINVQKEWGFAGDIAEGILALVSQDKVFEATIGTGVAHSILEWLELCFGTFGLDWRDYVNPIPNYRPDFDILVSDPTIMKSIGWSCTSDLNRLLELMLIPIISYPGRSIDHDRPSF